MAGQAMKLGKYGFEDVKKRENIDLAAASDAWKQRSFIRH